MFSGLFAPWRALRFLRKNKGLKRYIAIPLGINTVIFSIFLYSAVTWLPDIIGSWLPESDGRLIQMAYYFLFALSLTLLLLVSVIFFSIIGNIIASPFTDILTLKTEEVVLGIPPVETGFTPQDFLKMITAMMEELKRIGFAVAIFILLLPLNFLPFIGQTLYLFLDSLVLAIFLGLEFFSYSLDRRNYSFKQKLRFVKQRFFQVMGLGISAWILLLIPVINFCVLPLAAVGATLCFSQDKGP